MELNLDHILFSYTLELKGGKSALMSSEMWNLARWLHV